MSKEKIINKTTFLGVIGLGYVDLPLAVKKPNSVFKVISFNV